MSRSGINSFYKANPVLSPLVRFVVDFSCNLLVNESTLNTTKVRQEIIGWCGITGIIILQIICTSLQTDNHNSTSSLSFHRPDALPEAERCQSTERKQLTTTRNPKVIWEEPRRRPTRQRITMPQSPWVTMGYPIFNPPPKKLPLPFDDLYPM